MKWASHWYILREYIINWRRHLAFPNYPDIGTRPCNDKSAVLSVRNFLDLYCDLSLFAQRNEFSFAPWLPVSLQVTISTQALLAWTLLTDVASSATFVAVFGAS